MKNGRIRDRDSSTGGGTIKDHNVPDAPEFIPFSGASPTLEVDDRVSFEISGEGDNIHAYGVTKLQEEGTGETRRPR